MGGFFFPSIHDHGKKMVFFLQKNGILNFPITLQIQLAGIGKKI